MAELNHAPLPLDNFPQRVAVLRWLLLIIEAGLATYMIFNFHQAIGILYLAYGIVSLFLIFPLIRCVRCNYYGKRCNFGWGKWWVAAFFQRDTESNYADYYGWSALFWPLRLLPILIGLRTLPGLISGRFNFESHGIFLIYLTILFLHRRYYRARACTRCLQKAICPVYTGRAVMAYSI